MANNENENQPVVRKTWTMLKKVDRNKYITFSEDIIPTFTSATTTDKYGLWKASGSGMTSGQGWYLFDKTTKTMIRSKGSSVTNKYMYVELTLPPNVEICVEEFEMYGRDWSGNFLMYIEGYNTETNSWERITEKVGLTHGNSNISMLTIIQKYYNRFRWANYNPSYQSIENYTDMYLWRFKKGTLKEKPIEE